MQADGGLIQNIKHTGQAGTNLGGQANTLALTTRQGSGRAVHGKVFQANIVEELQALTDFLEDAICNFVLLVGELFINAGEPVVCGFDGKGCDLAYMAICYFDAKSLRLEAVAFTSVASMVGLVA